MIPKLLFAQHTMYLSANAFGLPNEIEENGY